MRQSLVQDSSQEKYRGKLGQGGLSVFNVDSVKYLCQKLLIIFQGRLFRDQPGFFGHTWSHLKGVLSS